jgi:hypothetical protein
MPGYFAPHRRVRISTPVSKTITVSRNCHEDGTGD